MVTQLADPDGEAERPQSPATSASATEHASSGASSHLCRGHTLRLHRMHAASTPSPYLDVLSIQSRRLVAQTQAQIAAHEAQAHAQRGHDRESRDGRDAGDGNESEAQRLERLLESVRLLVEPIQIPDLSHTGVFHDSVSQLQPTFEKAHRVGAPSSATLTLSSVEKEKEIKLFYPTGAKKVNMREYIQETIQRHLATASTQSCADLPLCAPASHQAQTSPSRSSTKLGVSASAPVIAASVSSSAVSPSPTKSTVGGGAKTSVTKPTKKSTASPLKHKKPKTALSSPAASSSPLLNPELTRQAKDIIAAVRANSSKINELMSS